MTNLEKINQLWVDSHKKDDGWRFEIELNENEFIQDGFDNLYREYVKEGVYSDSFALLVVNSLFHLDRSIFFNFNENEKLARNELKMSAELAFLSIDLASQSCECFKGQSNIDFSTTTFLLAFAICIKDVEDFTKIGNHIINSLNAKSCIVKRGDEDDLLSWFIIELFLKSENIQLNRAIARYPEELKYYNKVIKEWDTEDMILVEQLIYFLSELHIDKVMQIFDQIEDDDYEEDYRCYGNVVAGAYDYRSSDELPFIMLFPYEILTWLKLRELKGLKNPKTFTHPLMNTPIAKMFLDIKEPLPYPKELPYAKELLEKLKEKCPAVEIPEWLGGEKESEKETAPIPTIHLKSNQLAPKTGRYQATLNQDHPQAEFLKTSGFDVKKVEEGESIGTFGLSGEDEEDIVWVYLGE